MSKPNQSNIDPDPDFRQIIPRLGSKSEAFEEICCQLARRHTDGRLHRLHGAGGDGGVECYVDTAEGRWGWQAKYVFNVNSLISQASKSLETAMSVHTKLTRFVLSFPFDLTGPTARRGLSGTEKLNQWISQREQAASRQGRQLTIEAWPASQLRSLLVDHDVSGGMRLFFFGTAALSHDWFTEHLKKAFATAGPRYTPELNVDTDLHRWVAAFGRESSWTEAVKANLSPLRDAEKRLGYVLHQPDEGSSRTPTWPDTSLATTLTVVERLQPVLATLKNPQGMAIGQYDPIATELSALTSELREVEAVLVRDIEDRYGEGKADSPHWRQFMAERMVSFPAEHLDSVRKLLNAVDDLTKWIRSLDCALAFRHHFVLAGEAGTGKTHGVCDAAKRRHEAGLLTCIVFGHQFGGHPDPWSRIAEALGLSQSLGAERLLDFLNAAGEASGYPLVLCIDAINETKPLSYWRKNVAALVQSVRRSPHIRLFLVCKSTYLSRCIPEGNDHFVANHHGFAGIERQACKMYFQHFDLRPPIAPILQPELANPLYLRLVCETLNKAGLDRLPPGWSGGGSAIIRDFLDQKASQFSFEFENAQPGASTKSLIKIIKAIAASDSTSLSWTKARSLIESEVESADATLIWLVNESLLIQDVIAGDSWEEDTVLRPAFERLGDFLIASEVLTRIPDGELEQAAQSGGILHPWLQDVPAIQSNRGFLGEFAVLAAERFRGFELSDLANDSETYDKLASIAIQTLVFRNADSLTSSTARVIYDAFGKQGLAYEAQDAVLSCSWRPSFVDAMWLHQFFGKLPMHVRDAFWCRYLHESFESEGVVKNLTSAVDELSLNDIEPEIALRWTIVLLWFTAAADRRVKDHSTRAATSILTSVSSIVSEVIALFIEVDDDEVRERVLLCCYGALLMSRDLEVIQSVAASLYGAYIETPDNFDNALIRDHMRCICELSLEVSLGSPPDIVPEALTNQPALSNWPLGIPSDEQVKEWADSLRFRPDEFYSDFFKYTMGCLRPWRHGLSKLDMGKWISQRVARDFSFFQSDCQNYDSWMLHKYGGGRSKPVWAERIAKKYAWIALSQLGSRLNDHVERQPESWKKDRIKIPLILPERRGLDPTIPKTVGRVASAERGWNVPKPKDICSLAASGFESWLKESAMPTLRDIASSQTLGNRQYRPIMAYLDWDGVEKDIESVTVYRHVWANLQGFIVPSDQIKRVYRRLRGHNLFGQWLPRSLHFLYGFVAEYPWGTVFEASEAEERQEFPPLNSGEAPISVIPAWSEVVSEWEYDTSEPNWTVHVPSKRLLAPQLRWDLHGGFATADGNSVFLDPSFRNTGPPALLADVNYLTNRLKTEGLAIILTLVGEKQLRTSGFSDLPNLPRCRLSQVGFLDGETERFSKPIFSVE